MSTSSSSSSAEAQAQLERARRVLELAARLVSEHKDTTYFIGDDSRKPLHLSITPLIQLRKTGGTTGHREQGGNWIHYELLIPAENIKYSFYIKPASADEERNQTAAVTAILYLRDNWNNNSVFTHQVKA